MVKFSGFKTPQKFASIHNHFNKERHLYSRKNFKLNRSSVLAALRALSAA